MIEVGLGWVQGYEVQRNFEHKCALELNGPCRAVKMVIFIVWFIGGKRGRTQYLPVRQSKSDSKMG